MYDLDGVALSGCLLSSLLTEAASPYAGPDQRSGTRYAEGLLLGTVSRRQGTETGDAHEERATSHRETGISSYVRSPERYSFYDSLGVVNEAQVARLVPQGERLAGYFVARKGESTRPSLRELEVFRNLAKTSCAGSQPLVLLLVSLRLAEGVATQSFRYQCLGFKRGSDGTWPAERLEVLPCRVSNVAVDSMAEYSTLRPSPLLPLGVDSAQTSVLAKTFDPIPPPYVVEAEAILDQGIETMESLVEELKAVENNVVRLQVETRCMERVYVRRVREISS